MNENFLGEKYQGQFWREFIVLFYESHTYQVRISGLNLLCKWHEIKIKHFGN